MKLFHQYYLDFTNENWLSNGKPLSEIRLGIPARKIGIGNLHKLYSHQNWLMECPKVQRNMAMCCFSTDCLLTEIVSVDICFRLY